MLLAVDIGNTNIKFGIFDGERLTSKFSIQTKRDSTTEDIGAKLRGNISYPIKTSLICSVVPELDGPLSTFLKHDLGIDAVFVTNGFDFGLKINYEPLAAIGTDRLVNCFAAAEKYVNPCIVCSFGTALTIDVVSRDRVLVGGLIAPGINTLASALKLTTSQLPEVEIIRPSTVLQNTTVGAIQSGIFHGYLGLFEGLLKAVKEEIEDEPTVIATGGFAEAMAGRTSQINIVDQNLTLDGLRLAAQQSAYPDAEARTE